ncbi:UNVERIFIED_CONTAM: hypothetical protein FKN15_075534 [Acipenser sinensis]
MLPSVSTSQSHIFFDPQLLSCRIVGRGAGYSGHGNCGTGGGGASFPSSEDGRSSPSSSSAQSFLGDCDTLNGVVQ